MMVTAVADEGRVTTNASRLFSGATDRHDLLAAFFARRRRGWRWGRSTG
jgi:hypothetical protein